MIDWVLSSVNKFLRINGTLDSWQPPFEGVSIGDLRVAADENIEGILRQGIRLTASLSTLALDAERDEDDIQPKRYAEQWATSISDELKLINPHLASHFRKRLKISESNVMTSFGFFNEKYVSNFGLLVPTRLSTSLSNVKAKLFDLEALKKSNILLKPEVYEIVVGTPSLNDPTLSEKAVKRLQDTIEMITEVASADNINLYRAENARQAAEHISEAAA